VRSRHGLIEAVPALLATFAALYYLTDLDAERANREM
jgi:hypothetical protein